MPQEKQTKTNTRKILVVIIFILVAGFGFGRGEEAKADYCICSETENAIMLDLKFYLNENNPYTQSSCEKACIDSKYFYIQTTPYSPDSLEGRALVGGSKSITSSKAPIASSGDIKPDTCEGISITNPKSWFNCILLYILSFMGSLLSLSATLFSWVTKPENITSIIDNEIVYQTWGTVRDTLNVSFIMFLLFSAFATVFQIDKYSYKKTLLTIVIMALLVNFSFPISRFIIDVSNMLMYYFISVLEVGSRIKADDWFVTIASGSALEQILNSGSINSSSSSLIASVIFTFILAVTLLTIAILFLIRTIALAILIIFSSLAFIGAAIPPLSSYASDWWKKLFNYAFFGPIMIFMLYISISMQQKINQLELGNIKTIAAKHTADPTFLSAISFFIIPIVILWMGIGVAQSMSAVGAGAVVGKAQGFIKGVGRNLSTRPAKAISIAGVKAFDRNVLGNWLHISPRQIMEGWKKSTQEAEETKLAYGKGLWHDRINRIFSFGKQKSNYAEIARQDLTSKKMKQVQSVSQESAYLLDRMSNLLGEKSPEAIAELKGIFRTLYSNNDQDELMGYIKENIEKGTPIGKIFSSKKFGFNKSNWGVSERNVSEAILKIFQESKIDDQEINKEFLDLGNIAAAKQGVGFSAVFYNPDTKQFERIVGDPKYNGRQGWNSAKKMMTMGEAQNIPKSMHRNNFTDQEGNLNDTGKSLLRVYANPTAIKQADRHKSDFFRSLCIDNDGEISKKMLKYAAALRNGKADGWDDNKGAYSEEIHDIPQSINAAAWTLALKVKSGNYGKTDSPDKTAMGKDLTDAGFSDTGEIEKIIAIATTK